MKGYQVLINNSQKISGGIHEGSTMVLITFRDGLFRVNFSSIDQTGMIAYTWYVADLKLGDKLDITYQEIIEDINPAQVVDYNNQEEMDRMALEGYYKMKAELIKEGILDKEQ